MDYISVKEFAQKYGVSERTARNYCASGKIEGVVLVGKTWNIPADATLPMRKSKKQQVSPLLSILREQKNMKLKGGIYHRTQIDLTYNSNHIEGSRLSHEQTRFIFETNTIGITDQSVRVDDIIETTNHFRCIDLIIEQADEKLTEDFNKYLKPVLNESGKPARKAVPQNKQRGALTESQKEITGNRAPLVESAQEDDEFASELDNLAKIAGIRK